MTLRTLPVPWWHGSEVLTKAMDERSSEKKSKRKKKVTLCIAIKYKVNNYEPRLPYLAALEIKKKPGKVGLAFVVGVRRGKRRERENRGRAWRARVKGPPN